MLIFFVLVLFMYFLAELYFFFVTKRLMGFCFSSLGGLRLVLCSAAVTAAVSLGAILFSSYYMWLIFILHILVFNLLTRVANFIISRTKLSASAAWRGIYRLSIIPLVLTVGFFAYGYFNMSNIVRTSYTAETDKLSEPFVAVLMADIHYGTAGNIGDIRDMVEDINREGAQIAVLCGDIIDESADLDTAREIFAELGKIETEHGVYFVYGNHDCSAYLPNPSYSRKELESVIRSSGIEILADEYREITDGLILAGRLDKSMDRKPVDKLLDGVDRDKFILMADHQPTDFAEKEQAGVSMQISGHTHGGQLFPVGYINTLISPNELCYGMEKSGSMDAIVTSGVYGWGFPIRTQGHSEWVMIEIKGAD